MQAQLPTVLLRPGEADRVVAGHPGAPTEGVGREATAVHLAAVECAAGSGYRFLPHGDRDRLLRSQQREL